MGYGARAFRTCLGVLGWTVVYLTDTDGVDSVGGSIALKHWAGWTLWTNPRKFAQLTIGAAGAGLQHYEVHTVP